MRFVLVLSMCVDLTRFMSPRLIDSKAFGIFFGKSSGPLPVTVPVLSFHWPELTVEGSTWQCSAIAKIGSSLAYLVHSASCRDAVMQLVARNRIAVTELHVQCLARNRRGIYPHKTCKKVWGHLIWLLPRCVRCTTKSYTGSTQGTRRASGTVQSGSSGLCKVCDTVGRGPI